MEGCGGAMMSRRFRLCGDANLPFFVILFGYVIFCALVATLFQFPLNFRLYSTFFLFTAPLLVIVVVIGGALIALVRHFPDKPFPFLRDLFTTQWRIGDRIAVGLPIVLVYPIFLSAFTSFKAGIPAMMPFYADPWLSSIDAFVSPISLLEPLLKSDVALRSLDALYVAWFPINCAILLIAAFSLKDLRSRSQYQVAFLLSWFLLGNVAAMLGSSVGPCFYPYFFEGDPYSSLMNRLAEIRPLITTDSQKYLIDGFRNGGITFGEGISAFPSLHVGMAMLGAIYVYSRSHILGVMLFAYTGLIFIGSILLGWHYAIDGYVSLIGVPIIWMLSEKIVKAFASHFALLEPVA